MAKEQQKTEMPDLLVADVTQEAVTASTNGEMYQVGTAAINFGTYVLTMRKMAWRWYDADYKFFYNRELTRLENDGLEITVPYMTDAELTEDADAGYAHIVKWEVAPMLEATTAKHRTTNETKTEWVEKPDPDHPGQTILVEETVTRKVLILQIDKWDKKKKKALVDFVDAAQKLAVDIQVATLDASFSKTEGLRTGTGHDLSYTTAEETDALPMLRASIMIPLALKTVVNDFLTKVFGVKTDDPDEIFGWWRACQPWRGFSTHSGDFVLGSAYLDALTEITLGILIGTNKDGTRGAIVGVTDPDNPSGSTTLLKTDDVPEAVLLNAWEEGPAVTEQGSDWIPSPVIIGPDGVEHELELKLLKMPEELNAHSIQDITTWVAHLGMSGTAETSTDAVAPGLFLLKSYAPRLSYDSIPEPRAIAYMPKGAYGAPLNTALELNRCLLTAQPSSIGSLVGDCEAYTVRGQVVDSSKAAYNQEAKHLKLTLDNGRNADPSNNGSSGSKWSLDCKWWWWLIAIVVVFFAYKILGATDNSRAARTAARSEARKERAEAKRNRDAEKKEERKKAAEAQQTAKVQGENDAPAQKQDKQQQVVERSL